MISVDEARALILKEARSFGTEKIPLEKSFGRVLAEDVRADRDYPPFNRSAMDGFAVKSTGFDGGTALRVENTVFAGDAPGRAKGAAAKIMTGAVVPAGFDAVIKKEDANLADDSVSFKNVRVLPWLNIARQGEDLRRGQKIEIKGARIENTVATLLASLGINKPLVQKLPSITILTTGNEIIGVDKRPKPQQIRNSNVFALKSLLGEYGILKIKTKHVADDRVKLRTVLRASLTSDIIFLTGGVSAGDSDYVPDVLSDLKVKKVFHKIAIKPGKPLWFGVKGRSCVFAIPGNPFSSQVVFRVFVDWYLRACFGMEAAMTLRLPLSSLRKKKDSLRHYFPVRLRDSSLEVLALNGSGDIRAGLGSHGLAVHPESTSEIQSGDLVEFIPWR